MITKAQIQYINGLRIKKFRQKYNQFVVEGAKAVNELLFSSFFIPEILFATENWVPPKGFSEAQYQIIRIKQTDMGRISQHQSLPDVVAVVPIPEWSLPDTAELKGKRTFILDNIQDPGNLGTIIRIADWYGMAHVICSSSTVDAFNPKTIASTMGSFLRVKVHYTALPEFIGNIRLPVFGCVMDGESVYQAKKSSESLIIIGNEGHGISQELLPLVSDKISIPRFGGAESLNAAVAAAIVADNFAREISA